jgi:AraC family transcriptional regulator, regulatory protein of adaptative response / methylated-DNA-[protein]-cysteine methyltransferase
MAMNIQENINYNRIAEAIEYLKVNFKSQPTLDEVAEKVNLSPFHFQRLFTDWAGVSPKKFLQYLSLNYVKSILKNDQTATLFDITNDTGLSSTSRLHDLFVNIEAMTPGEYKNGGENLKINYSFASTVFGEIIVASTTKGICYIAFFENKNLAIEHMIAYFPKAIFFEKIENEHQNALKIFTADWSQANEIKLHLKGTDFQLKVWDALLKIPLGKLSTYGQISEKINNPKASRAVGSAIGDNPVAYLIPCHRVIQSTGQIGGYMWGPTRKSAILGWEAAQVNG